MNIQVAATQKRELPYIVVVETYVKIYGVYVLCVCTTDRQLPFLRVFQLNSLLLGITGPFLLFVFTKRIARQSAHLHARRCLKLIYRLLSSSGFACFLVCQSDGHKKWQNQTKCWTSPVWSFVRLTDG